MKKYLLFIVLFLSATTLLFAQDKQSIYEQLNLDYPGLESVKKYVLNKEYQKADQALLDYYKNRTKIKHPDYNPEDKAAYLGKPLPKDVQEKADKGMIHHFFVHKGYGFIDYGKDINWQHWPIKDNEIRWQLHRTYWWMPMGLAYWSSGNEKYAEEWTKQYIDWIKKNPLGLSKENDRFAWRPLEVSTRLQDQTAMFNLFKSSKYFTQDFLIQFLNNYYNHAHYLESHYSDKGNHLLFEAQRMIYAGCFFPEFKDAAAWRKSGIDILNKEIKVQVYPDGLQFELSPNYHVAAINIFLKALYMTQLAGLENEFPASYKNTVENMIMAVINFSFPDYSYPMFSDAKLETKADMLKNYKEWTKVFPQNQQILFMATDGKKGQKPEYLSNALKNGGFYTFRNGWNMNATAMVIKASPPAFWHSQPDNGTFDLWVKGRNFMPDAGCYVYGGDAEIMKKRNWYRQSRVHKTLTLDNKDMDTCDAQLIKWDTAGAIKTLQYFNPSYKGLDHYRTILFVDNQYFIIIDEAKGTAKGQIGVHYQLADNNAVLNVAKKSATTRYTDGNNLFIQEFDLDNQKAILTKEEGKVSYEYRQEQPRDAFVYTIQKKDDTPVRFFTVLYPFKDKVPTIKVKQSGFNSFELTINGKTRQIQLP